MSVFIINESVDSSTSEIKLKTAKSPKSKSKVRPGADHGPRAGFEWLSACFKRTVNVCCVIYELIEDLYKLLYYNY